MPIFSTKTLNDIIALARSERLDPAALLAVAEVESGGRAFALIDGRKEPLIRFEGHYFDRLLSGAKRDAARRAGLASPKAGAVKNPRSQAARWQMLERARKIDSDAAYQSVSWGVGQVMGSHWKALGYASVDALVADARQSVAGQVRLMLKFIEVNNLKPLIEEHQWAAFARRYNGPGYRANRYDVKLAAAFSKHARLIRTGSTGNTSAGSPILKKGAKGSAVKDLQKLLVARGFAVGIDGDFGSATDAALRRFQASRNLDADGIAGVKTLAALKEADTVRDKTTEDLQKRLNFLDRLVKWIARLWPFWPR